MSQFARQTARTGIGAIVHDDAAADALENQKKQKIGVVSPLAQQLFRLRGGHAVRGKEYGQIRMAMDHIHDGNIVQPEIIGGGEDRAGMDVHRPHGRHAHADDAPFIARLHRIDYVDHHCEQCFLTHCFRIAALFRAQDVRAQIAQRRLNRVARNQYADDAGRGIGKIQKPRLPAGSRAAGIIAVDFLYDALFGKFGDDVAHAHLAQPRGLCERAP